MGRDLRYNRKAEFFYNIDILLTENLNVSNTSEGVLYQLIQKDYTKNIEYQFLSGFKPFAEFQSLWGYFQIT